MATENENVNVTITTPESESEANCSLSWEIDEDDNEGQTTYYPGTAYYARLFKGADIGDIYAFNTNGNISLYSSGEFAWVGASEEVYLVFENEKSSDLRYTYGSDFNYTLVGTAYDRDGNEISVTLTPPEQKGSTVTASETCFAVFAISYKTIYDKYVFVGEGGTLLLVASTECNSNYVSAEIEVDVEVISSSSISSSSSSSISSALITTSITLVYTDFVTGSPVVGAAIKVDGIDRGTTDDLGEILLQDITINDVHEVSASKEGYLNTDSDGLSNDRFMITLD